MNQPTSTDQDERSIKELEVVENQQTSKQAGKQTQTIHVWNSIYIDIYPVYDPNTGSYSLHGCSGKGYVDLRFT